MNLPDLISAVRLAFAVTGESECRIELAKRSGAPRYVTGCRGYRLCRTSDTPTGKEKHEGQTVRHYLCIDTDGHDLRVLRRYQETLRLHGLPAFLSATLEHPSVRCLYIDDPWFTLEGLPVFNGSAA